ASGPLSSSPSLPSDTSAFRFHPHTGPEQTPLRSAPPSPFSRRSSSLLPLLRYKSLPALLLLPPASPRSADTASFLFPRAPPSSFLDASSLPARTAGKLLPLRCTHTLHTLAARSLLRVAPSVRPATPSSPHTPLACFPSTPTEIPALLPPSPLLPPT